MLPRQCEISPPLTNTFPGVMSTEHLFSNDWSMENSSNIQQDLDPKGDDPQNYPYPISQGYHHQSIFLPPQPSTQEKPSPADSTKKKNAKKIPRPWNSLMAYRMDKQHQIMELYPGVNNKDIARIVGQMWKHESNEEKERYKVIAENYNFSQDFPCVEIICDVSS
ncbi:hypothetical protein BC937DRAFT_88406 [Endogone sp. FLAS-F59071]|nr:hypothetical protein BC937DRAFT_88406 [Endogone sp. FLAS-F59071]|eukprot:RUS18736.1 hypothetical protein BC937DRAFT_88406 [Endogone sp. FLAS-F59071]